MPEETRKPSAFVEYLTSLTPEKDRGTLAVLRRGLASPPGQDINMYRYVSRFVVDELHGTWAEKVHFLVAALYGFHPVSTDEAGNFGSHMAAAARQMPDAASTERRFTLLLNADRDDLADYLRQAISFIKSKDVPVNWGTLFTDLKYWEAPGRPVQQRWAKAFWAYQKPDDTKNDQSKMTTEEEK